jgi:hypothetical protein
MDDFVGFELAGFLNFFPNLLSGIDSLGFLFLDLLQHLFDFLLGRHCIQFDLLDVGLTFLRDTAQWLDHDPIDDEKKNQERNQLDDERFIDADHCDGADNLHGTRPSYFDVIDFVEMKRVRLVKTPVSPINCRAMAAGSPFRASGDCYPPLRFGFRNHKPEFI